MTLDETIDYCEKIAIKNEKLAEVLSKINENKIIDFCDSSVQEQNRANECAKEYRQLTRWLSELKKLREQQRPRGYWKESNRDTCPKCSICGELQDYKSNFCPNSGADMRDNITYVNGQCLEFADVPTLASAT